jgi:hypothetical protein
MSRTNQNELLANPASKFLQWKTKKKTIVVDGEELEKLDGGGFFSYDKETKENVEMDLPLTFAVLNMDMITLKGYDEKNKQGVWSNEFSKPEHDVVLRNKQGKLLSFKKSEYKLNKDAVSGFGAKWTNSIYIAIKNSEGGFSIGNIQCSGAALTGANDMESKDASEMEDGWMNFVKVNKSKLYSNFISVSDYKLKKKGTAKFTIPVFKLGKVIDEATAPKLDALDRELTEYLDFYFARPTTEVVKPSEELESVGEGMDY